MESRAFIEELETENQSCLGTLGAVTNLVGATEAPPDLARLLKIALANEISVSELAALWVPATSEWDIKIALAQQAGDEVRHFQLVEARLERLGVSLADLAVPPENAVVAYLKSLRTPVESIAAKPCS